MFSLSASFWDIHHLPAVRPGAASHTTRSDCARLSFAFVAAPAPAPAALALSLPPASLCGGGARDGVTPSTVVTPKSVPAYGAGRFRRPLAREGCVVTG